MELLKNNAHRISLTKDVFTIDEELFVRMCQVSTMFPMMQFSLAPWKFLNEDNLKICLDMAKLHKKMSPYIVEKVNESRTSGEPLVRHLEYEFPGQGFEHTTDCFMCADKYLVAPVMEKGMFKRTVKLPAGNSWKYIDGTVYEGGQTVTVDGSISMLSELQVAYETAKAVAPVAGTGIMEYSDLTAYNRALSNAKNLLAYGASGDQIVAAIAQLEAAVAGLTPNYPEADKTYFIVNALEAFEENHGVNMMLFVNNDGALKWMYENVDNDNRLWQFEPAEVEEGAPAAFYIRNVATGTYIGKADAQSTVLDMADNTGSTVAYNITSLEGTTLAIHAVTDAAFRLHANGHGDGRNKIGDIVYWGAGIGSSSAWTICESEEYIKLTDIDFTELESDEQIAPAQKGTYDLFGRRIVAPAAAGIYIVDGKKKVVK